MLSLLLALSAHALPPYAETKPPAVEAPAEDPFAWTTHYEASKGRIVATLVIPDGHTVYRDQVEVEVRDAGGATVGAADMPTGELKPDPAGRDPREQYTDDLVVYLPVEGGEGVVTLSLRHQGCRAGLCFAPVSLEQRVAVRAPGEQAR